MSDVDVYEPSYDVNAFCQSERMSKSKLYELWQQGKGPTFYWNGKHRRITHRARMDWQRQREAEALASRPEALPCP